MAVLSPIVNRAYLYIENMNLSWTSGTVIVLGSGACRDSSNVNDIVLDSNVSINAANNGANGLDTGSLANSTFYAVYAIDDSRGFESAAGLLSADLTSPLLPAGYDMYRRVGYVLTSGAGAILDFTQRGKSNDRWMYYANEIATDITAGQSATFAAVDASAAAPSNAKQLNLKIVLTPDAGGTRSVALRDGGSGSTAGQAFLSSAASVVATGSLVCPCGDSGDIDYLVSNASAAVAIDVMGYLDAL